MARALKQWSQLHVEVMNFFAISMVSFADKAGPEVVPCQPRKLRRLRVASALGRHQGEKRLPFPAGRRDLFLRADRKGNLLRSSRTDGDGHEDPPVLAGHGQIRLPVAPHIVGGTVENRITAGDRDTRKQTADSGNEPEGPLPRLRTVSPMDLIQPEIKPAAVDHHRIVVPYVDPHSPILISHGQQFRNGGAGEVLRRILPEGQRKQRRFLKSAACALDHEFLRISGAVLSLVAGHGEIGAVPTERDMGDVDHRLTNLFFPLQCR